MQEGRDVTWMLGVGLLLGIGPSVALASGTNSGLQYGLTLGYTF